MCGRYTLRSKPKAIAEEFDLPEVPQLHPASTSPRITCGGGRFDPNEGSRRSTPDVGVDSVLGGRPSIGDQIINARAETVPRSLRSVTRSEPGDAWFADGFYEWTGRTAGSPFLVHLRDDRRSPSPVLEHWERGIEPIYSCTLPTTDANEGLAPIHDRMPVILPRSSVTTSG